MSRVVVTGIGCAGPFGTDPRALDGAVRAGAPLGSVEPVETLRGRTRRMRLARLGPLDRESFVPARRLRRMGEVSQLWTIACLLARADSGLDARPDGMPEPSRRGTYVGTGFGCIDTTWDYLCGLWRDGAGMANPFLFSESVANAPAGHSSIEMDAQGESVTFTCGDASCAAAVSAAARAVAGDRLATAYAGGVELLPPPLLRVLAALGAPEFLGEGCVCFLLETLESARARGARIHAEIAVAVSGSDPGAAPTRWGTDPAPIARTMRRAIDRFEGRVRAVYLHAPGSPPSDAAEREAVRGLLPDVPEISVPAVTGSLAAAGGFTIAAAALGVGAGGTVEGAALVNAVSWGGTLSSLILAAPPP